MNITDIKRTINNKLFEETGLSVISNDITDIESNKPCFFVKILLLKYEKFQYISDIKIGVHINFFPFTKKEIEGIKMMDKLNNLFTKGLEIEGNIIEIEGINSEFENGFLRYSFQMEIDETEEISNDGVEYMKELEYKGEIK